MRLASAFDQGDDVRHLLRADCPVLGVELAHAGVVHVELDGARSLRPIDFQRFVGIGLRVVGFAGMTVGVEPDLVAEFAAEELVDGHAQRLADDIVEGVLDAGQGEDERGVG